MAPQHEEKERGEEPEHEGAAQEFRHAEHTHLGDRRLEKSEEPGADCELHEIGDRADGKRDPAGTWSGKPQGAKMQAMSET